MHSFLMVALPPISMNRLDVVGGEGGTENTRRRRRVRLNTAGTAGAEQEKGRR